MKNVNYREIYPSTSKPRLVYVVSPYKSNPWFNKIVTRRFCAWIANQKITPIAPHLLFPQFLNDTDEQIRSLAFDLNEELMSRVDEVWVLSGRISTGMCLEFDIARHLGKPVRLFHEEV